MKITDKLLHRDFVHRMCQWIVQGCHNESVLKVQFLVVWSRKWCKTALSDNHTPTEKRKWGPGCQPEQHYQQSSLVRKHWQLCTFRPLTSKTAKLEQKKKSSASLSPSSQALVEFAIINNLRQASSPHHQIGFGFVSDGISDSIC